MEKSRCQAGPRLPPSVMAMSLLVGIVVGAFGPHYSALTAVVFGKPGLAKWLFMSFTTDPTPPT